MKPSPHLMLALSGHGYGHLAQVAPVINALWQQLPALQLTVCSNLPQAVIAGRLDRAFTSRHVELDVVIPMSSAWEVDVAAACAAWKSFHRDLDAGLQRDVDLLGEIKPDLVFADVPYRILSAARLARIPAVALCSLNWASIYAAYCTTADERETTLRQMWDAYRAADVFLAPVPAMDMPELGNYRAIGPIARRGVQQRTALCEQLGLPRETRIVMVALGGIATTLPLANWPRMEKVAWLLPGAAAVQRDDLFDFSALPLAFIDMLASVDAVLTKPGYGTYAEAVCNGIPLLTLSRPDWPETPYLNAWARRHGRLQEISKQQFDSGKFAAALHDLWQQPPADSYSGADGIQQAVELLLERLRPRPDPLRLIPPAG
jgi:hypothetical protein